MRKDLVKKIVSISVVSLVLALVVATIVLALIPKRLANPINDGYSTITVYQDKVARQYLYYSNPTNEDEENYNEVYETIESLHAESLKDNMLSAMFQGLGSFGIEVVKSTKTNVTTDVAQATGNCIVFTYLQEDDQILKINGETYYDETSLKSEAVEYNMIVMPLSENKGFEERIIYLVDRESNKSNYQLKFLADQSELNDFIENLNLGIVA